MVTYDDFDYVTEAIKISQNLSSTWLNMSYEQKSELQQFVFPKGTTFEKEKQRVRTK